MEFRDKLQHKLESRISLEPNSGCWIWLGGVNSSGYGCIWGGKQYLIQRVSLFIYKGIPLDTPLDAQHSCHVKVCCNPNHLKYDTHAVNMADAQLFNRMRNQNIHKRVCKHGHELTMDNICFALDGHRSCRTCKQITDRARRAKDN